MFQSLMQVFHDLNEAQSNILSAIITVFGSGIFSLLILYVRSSANVESVGSSQNGKINRILILIIFISAIFLCIFTTMFVVLIDNDPSDLISNNSREIDEVIEYPTPTQLRGSSQVPTVIADTTNLTPESMLIPPVIITATSSIETVLPEAERAAKSRIASNTEWRPFKPYERDFSGVTMVLVPNGCLTIGTTENQFDYVTNALGA